MDNQTLKHTLVTGASAGIGAAFAHRAAREGYGVVLVARRRERLEALAEEVRDRYGVPAHVLPTDLSAPDAIPALVNRLAERDLRVDVLVNNAGFAIKESFAGKAWDAHAVALSVMLTGPTELCHRLGGPMLERGWGRIINVASLAAYLPPTPGNLYTPIKAYLLHLSHALDMTWRDQGVHVSALCPGFTYSEFHDVMGTREEVSRLPGFMWTTAEEVVDAGWRAVMRGDPSCIPGPVNEALAATSRLIPEKIRLLLASRSGVTE